MRRLAGVTIGWFGISMVADGVPTLLVPHQVAAHGGDATALGLLTTGALGAAAAAQLVAGAWSDRVGRRIVIGIGMAVAAVGLVGLQRPELLIPATVTALIGVAVVQAGYQPLLPDHIDGGRRGQAAGAKGLFDVGGAFVAFALLAAVLSDGNVTLALALLGGGLGASVLGGVALLGGAHRTAVSRIDPPAAWSGFPRILASRFLFLLAIYGVGRFLLLFAAERLGLAPDVAARDAGAALALLTLATALASLPAGWLADRFGRGTLMLAGGLLAGVGIGGLVIAESMATLLGGGMLMAVGSAAFTAGNWAAIADHGAGPAAGRWFGVAGLGTAGAAAAAGLLGPIIDAVETRAAGAGYPVAFGLASLLAVGGGAIGWWSEHAQTRWGQLQEEYD